MGVRNPATPTLPHSRTLMELLSFLNKWLHLISIVGVLGSVLFMRFAVLQAFPGAALDESDAGKEIRRQYGMLTGILWLVVLVTGFLNYYLVSNSPTAKVNGNYHMFVGMKIALVLIMFAIAMAMGHRNPQSDRPPNRALWLNIIALLGVIVLGISAHLNIARVSGAAYEKPSAPAGPGQTTPAPPSHP